MLGLPLSTVTSILAELDSYWSEGEKKPLEWDTPWAIVWTFTRRLLTRGAHLNNGFQLPLVKENHVISEGEANNSYFISQLLISTYIIDLPQSHINNFFFVLTFCPRLLETLLPQCHIFYTSSLTWTINVIKFILLGCPSLLFRTKDVSVSWHLCQTCSTLKTWKRKLWAPEHYFLMESVNNHSRLWRATPQKITWAAGKRKKKTLLCASFIGFAKTCTWYVKSSVWNH